MQLLREHQVAAQGQTDALSDAEKACRPDDETRTICMDLQQILPCPKLNNQKAYYKKKISLYNFCVYDLNLKKANCFLWDETTAQKGSNEINSCLYKWFQENKDAGFRHLRIFADNCVGQNKNLYVVLNCMRLVQSGELDTVTIEFMVAGHSFLPCDRTFGNIEKKVKKRSIVNCPAEYAEIIRTSTKDGVNVFRMTSSDFFDFKDLKKLVKERKPLDFNFTDGRTFKISRENHWSYVVSCRKGVETVSLEPVRPPIKQKGKKPTQKSKAAAPPILGDKQLESAYLFVLTVDPSKIAHIQQLKKYLEPIGRQWVDALVESQIYAQQVEADQEQLADLGDPELTQDQDLLCECTVPAPSTP